MAPQGAFFVSTLSHPGWLGSATLRRRPRQQRTVLTCVRSPHAQRCHPANGRQRRAAPARRSPCAQSARVRGGIHIWSLNEGTATAAVALTRLWTTVYARLSSAGARDLPISDLQEADDQCRFGGVTMTGIEDRANITRSCGTRASRDNRPHADAEKARGGAAAGRGQKTF